MNKYQQLELILKNSKHICFFTGAGISVPSNIPDFRSSNGLYNEKNNLNYSLEEIISHSFFLIHPKDFFAFYKNKMVYPKAMPNKAHYFIAKLQDKTKVSVVTQNIDGLHSLAGSKDVYELHGSIHRNYCMKCHKFYSLDEILNKNGIPLCDEDQNIIKPDVVLYEEQLDETIIEGAINAISHADTLIVIGTSLLVYPAASFLKYFRGQHLILINKSKTSYDDICELTFNEDIINVIDKIKI